MLRFFYEKAKKVLQSLMLFKEVKKEINKSKHKPNKETVGKVSEYCSISMRSRLQDNKMKGNLPLLKDLLEY